MRCSVDLCVFRLNNPRAFIERKNEYRRTLIKKGTSIGANATIICGCTLGEYSFVGAGCVVTRDVPSHAIVYGSPAKLHGWMCRCGAKLGDNLACPDCGKSFRRIGDGLIEA